MKKTVIKCAVFSFSVFILVHAVATLGYCGIIDDALSMALQIVLLIAALPSYYFVKRNEEKLFAYPLIMAAFAALAFAVFWTLILILSDKNIIKGWDVLLYFLTWGAIACYFGLVLTVDLIIAAVDRIRQHIFRKKDTE